nr:Ig-like domain-containing protein [Prevotella sp.]
MKRITRLLAFMVALFSFSTAFAETGTETELTAENGGKDNPIVGQSYEIAGTYNAGPGSAQAGNMTSKGFKCRTGSDGNRVVFAVATNYTITKFVGEGISNYPMADGAEGNVNVKVTKVEVDGVEVAFTGGEFPAKGSDYSGNLTIENIQAKESIAIYFDNSNSAGKQVNLCYAIDWERPEATEPTITVTPEAVALIPGASYQLSVKVDPTSFTTVWKSADESLATVTEDGLVTAVAPGVVQVSHQWTENEEVADAATITISNVDLSKYAVAKSYDFTTMGDVTLELQSEAAGKIWNQANNVANNVFFCTNAGLEQIAVQAALSGGKGWSIVDGKGLALGSGAGRCAAVGGITKGQIVEIIYTGDAFYTNPAQDDGIEKEALNEGKGRAIYRASEDGMIGFEIIKGNAVEKINIYEVSNELPKLLTFPDYNDAAISAYDKEWTATVDGAVWTLNGFNNNSNKWNYVRCGRKTKAHTATILSPAFKANVTDVVYIVDKTSNVVKATVTVLNGEETVKEIDITEQFAVGYVDVKVEGAPGYSYLLTVESDDQASGNGTTQISKVGLYGEGQFVEPHIANTVDDPYTVAKAIELIDVGEALNEEVFVKGIISQIDEVNTEYGNATYWISDDGTTGTQLQCYRGLNIGGEKFTAAEELAVGAKVVVTGKLTKYNETYEFAQGNQLVSYSVPADVTSEYLKNADFSESTPTEAEAIYGYGKDGSPYSLQDVEQWTTVFVQGDNGNADYPNSGMGGAVMAYGSPTILKGNNVTAPATDPEGNAGNCLGFFAVWGCGGYYAQDVTLAPGEYTLTVPIYNQSGTSATTSYTGFFVDGSDKSYTVATNPEPGAWATQTVKFIVTTETKGQIRLGYKSNGSGSSANPMIFIDGIKIKHADIDAFDIAKVELETEIAAAEAMLATGENGKAELEAAIATAKDVLATATTAAEVNAAIDALKAAELAFKTANAPVPAGTYYVMSASQEGDWFMAAGHNWGTRAILNNEGLDLNFIYDAPSGKYTIETNIYNGGNKHFLGDNLYMDSPAYGWTITPTSSITFTIGNGTQYIGYDSDFNLAMVDTPAEWAFIDAAYLQAARQEEGLEAMKAATADNGVDATFLLKDPQFNRNDHRWDAWTVSENCTNKNLGGGCDGNTGNGCAESYHSPFTISQLVQGAPAGIYTLTAQGFYRQDDEVEEPAPNFFIGDATGEVPVKTGEENSMTAAGASFEQGLYTIEPITFEVTEGGELIVGVTNGENAHQWVIWDNFRLTYYGAAANKELADGTYYFQNVATGKFLAAGHSWGTRSIVDATGLDFTIAKAEDGKYTLDSQVANNATSHFLGSNLFVDAAAYGWTIENVGDGIFTLSDGTQFLAVGDNNETALVAEAGEAAQWKVMTYADRLAELATATEAAPVNATFVIKDANFNRNDQ